MAEETFKEDAFYLVKITDEEKEAEHEERDTWGTVVLTGQNTSRGSSSREEWTDHLN